MSVSYKRLKTISSWDDITRFSATEFQTTKMKKLPTHFLSVPVALFLFMGQQTPNIDLPRISAKQQV